MSFAQFRSYKTVESGADEQLSNVLMFGQPSGSFDFMKTTSAGLTAVETSENIFATTTASITSGFFGAFGAPAATFSQFGASGTPAANTNSGIFGIPSANTNSGIFATPSANTNSGIFGTPGNMNFGFGDKGGLVVTSKGSVVFGATTAATSSGIFGVAATPETDTNSSFSNALGATASANSGNADAVKSSAGFFGASFLDGNSHKAFGSTPGGFHGGFQTSSIGFSGASSSSQILNSSIPSSGSQFGSLTLGQGSFNLNSNMLSTSSSGAGYFGKQAKSDEHEASKHVSFRKEDQQMEKSGAGSNRGSSGKTGIPDLMSLSPSLFNKKGMIGLLAPDYAILQPIHLFYKQVKP